MIIPLCAYYHTICCQHASPWLLITGLLPTADTELHISSAHLQDPSGAVLPRLLQLLGAVKPAWQVFPLLTAWLRHFPSMRQFTCNKVLVSHLQTLFSHPSPPPANSLVSLSAPPPALCLCARSAYAPSASRSLSSWLTCSTGLDPNPERSIFTFRCACCQGPCSCEESQPAHQVPQIWQSPSWHEGSCGTGGHGRAPGHAGPTQLHHDASRAARRLVLDRLRHLPSE